MRLRFKQPEKVVKKRSPTELRVAVQQGVIPKARKPFALFLSSYFKEHGTTLGDRQGRMDLMRRAATSWNSLDFAGRAPYLIFSADEFTEQRAQAIRKGFANGPHALRSGPVSSGSSSGACALKLPMRFGDFVACDESPLGEGTYGKVIKGVHVSTGRFVAIKCFKDHDGELELEIRVYNALLKATEKAHPLQSGGFLHIVQMQAHGSMPWMAMPFVGSGSVSVHIRAHGPLQGMTLQAFMAQVATGLQFLHMEAAFLHLDVKPGNVLWDHTSRHARICDFGLSEPFPVTQEMKLGSTFFSTPYRHPELYRVPCEPLAARCYLKKVLTPRMDWWAAGCMFFEVACGDPLFPWSKLKGGKPTPCHSRIAVERYAAQTHSARALYFSRVPLPWRSALRRMLDPQPHVDTKWDEQCPKWFRFQA